MTDNSTIRADFPILKQIIHGNKPLIYFDNGATTKKPQVVMDCMNEYYTSYNSNIHRGAHFLANKATERYEDARITIANFIGAIVLPKIYQGKCDMIAQMRCVAIGVIRRYITDIVSPLCHEVLE